MPVDPLSLRSSSSLRELEELALSAETPEDLEAVRQLLAESEILAGTGEPVGSSAAGSNRWVVSTLSEVAEFFDLSIQSMWAWRSGANPMPGEEGHWDLREIVRWKLERAAKASVSQKSARVLELEERQLAADVEKRELAVSNARGELVLRTSVKATLADVLNRARTEIEAIPSELGPSIPADVRSELTHQITQKVRLILRKLSQERGVFE